MSDIATIPPVIGSLALVTIDLTAEETDHLLRARGWEIVHRTSRPDALVPPSGRSPLEGGEYAAGDFLLSRQAALTAALRDEVRSPAGIGLFASTEAPS